MKEREGNENTDSGQWRNEFKANNAMSHIAIIVRKKNRNQNADNPKESSLDLPDVSKTEKEAHYIQSQSYQNEVKNTSVQKSKVFNFPVISPTLTRFPNFGYRRKSIQKRDYTPYSIATRRTSESGRGKRNYCGLFGSPSRAFRTIEQSSHNEISPERIYVFSKNKPPSGRKSRNHLLPRLETHKNFMEKLKDLLQRHNTVNSLQVIPRKYTSLCPPVEELGSAKSNLRGHRRHYKKVGDRSALVPVKIKLSM